MKSSRRNFLFGMTAAALWLKSPFVPAFAAEARAKLKVAALSPWMANQVSLTRDGMMFLGLPRYSPDKDTPSLVRREADGTLKPFPGNEWNEWRPGKDGTNAFVYLNAVHIFADDTIWCVDQGSLSEGLFPGFGVPQPNAQKLVQLDAVTGKILSIHRFDETILPKGAQMNDLRRHGDWLYITDSGLGGIILHNLKTDKTLRRLSGHKLLKATPGRVPKILAHIKGKKKFTPPNSDLIEVTYDDKWLYFASPTGPLRRIETRFLQDTSLSDEDLAKKIQHIYDNTFSGGCAMDSAGNFYFCETETGRITKLTPSGDMSILVEDPRLIRPDGAFISRDSKLYVPVKKPYKGTDGNAPIFAVYSVDL